MRKMRHLQKSVQEFLTGVQHQRNQTKKLMSVFYSQQWIPSSSKQLTSSFKHSLLSTMKALVKCGRSNGNLGNAILFVQLQMWEHIAKQDTNLLHFLINCHISRNHFCELYLKDYFCPKTIPETISESDSALLAFWMEKWNWMRLTNMHGIFCF